MHTSLFIYRLDANTVAFQAGSSSANLAQFNISSALIASDSAVFLHDIQSAVDQLHRLWQEAQGQMTDRERHLSHLLQFQQLYHSALLTISQWLDRAEGRLFEAPRYGRDSEEVLKECEEIRTDMEHVHAQLDGLNKLCIELRAETSAENGRLIQEAVTQLGERVVLLESQATQKHLELVEEAQKSREANQAVAQLHQELENAREKLHELENSKEPVDEQDKEVRFILAM